MKKDEFLNLFRLTTLYNKKREKEPFKFNLNNNIENTGNCIDFSFYENKIILSICSNHFLSNEASKTIFLKFLLKDNELVLVKDESFKNEIFEHLKFNNNMYTDLSFLSDIIYNTLIPRYDLKWNYCEMRY